MKMTNPNPSPIGLGFGFVLFGASAHNGLMKNSGFIGSYTHFSLAHLWFIQFLPIIWM